jgi:DNA-directed RNA polymerase specialized sigma subunit
MDPIMTGQMDDNLRFIAQYYDTPEQLQRSIDRCRTRVARLVTQQQRAANDEALANYLRLAECKGWPCV